MFKPKTRKPIFIEELPIASLRINQLMNEFKQNWHNPVISRGLFQTEFMSSYATNDAIITLCYHRSLDQTWQKTAQDLAHKLDVSIVGRYKGHKIVIGQDFICEKFKVKGKTYIYQQPEGMFSQPNAVICEQMLNWVVTNSNLQNLVSFIVEMAILLYRLQIVRVRFWQLKLIKGQLSLQDVIF